MRGRVFIVSVGLLAVAAGGWLMARRLLPLDSLKRRLKGSATVADRIAEYGDSARARLVTHFHRAGVSYPPATFVLAGFKQERELHVFASDKGRGFKFVRTYPVYAASGVLGPKLRVGDLQVPEGIYRIESLNPNSQFHLSLRIGYPNQYDRARAGEEGRRNLGGDIMIHGGSASIGCLAIGDEAAEELFVMAADTGWHHAKVILSPVDFRSRELPETFQQDIPWVRELYAQIREELASLPLAGKER
jgi:L,D-transpeptidase catalytic domain